jgi:hypothetical protein
METNIDNESFTEEMNADLKSASEADTLPMDAKASGPATVALKTTSQVSIYFTVISISIYLLSSKVHFSALLKGNIYHIILR